jgi:hypothetical protein
LKFIRDHGHVDRSAAYADELKQAQAEFEASDEWQALVRSSRRLATQAATVAAAERELADAEQRFASGESDLHGTTPDSYEVTDCRRNLEDQRRGLAVLQAAHDRQSATTKQVLAEHNRRLRTALTISLGERREAVKAKILAAIGPLLTELEFASKGLDSANAAGAVALLKMPVLPAGPQTAVVADPRQLQSSLPPNAMPGTPRPDATAAELVPA